jgi:hypothetical protein
LRVPGGRRPHLPENTEMALVTKDLYDVRILRPRLATGDAIVLVGALVAFLIGWAIKDWHDDRVRTTDVAGVSISYPREWIRFPTREPEVFRAVSNEDGLTSMFLAMVTTPQTDLLQAVATNNANPARGEPGYVQLGNRSESVDGLEAIVTDYAYVRSAVGGSSVPAVIQGRQFAWIKDGQLFTFAVEGADDEWSEIRSMADRFAGKLETGA